VSLLDRSLGRPAGSAGSAGTLSDCEDVVIAEITRWTTISLLYGSSLLDRSLGRRTGTPTLRYDRVIRPF
jgi:hypothetical protein